VTHRKWWAALLLLGFCLPAAEAQRRRDPLTEVEAEEMRETAAEPNKRLKRMAEFASARLLAVEQLRKDPKLARSRGDAIHDLLEDFTNLVDEIGDNIGMYLERREDFRKGLINLVEAHSDWEVRLRTLKETSEAAELKSYEFILENAMEAVKEGGEDSRAAIDDVNRMIAEKKNSKK
jgi:hypothetical protein